ncbi:diacylglycerol O-acyltransferase 2-like, partial [Sabethes cyaneus]|uniref:diacylglycerol O-acyltransferase 2-like n=1 Tax=Sabethes cyaneus TaxID=53552 RepID=UPI00237EDC37
FSTGCFLNFATDTTGFPNQFPGIRSRVVTLDFHLLVPFFRELIFSWGAASCSEQSIINLVQAPNDPSDARNSDGYTSNAAVIIVGGAAESLHCRPNNYRLVLKKRRGFCRIALKTGTPIVPVINFGELDLYDQASNPPGSLVRRFQEKFKATTGIAPVAFVGRGFFQYSFGMIPRRKPINTVIGAPVEVTKIDNPSKEDIEALHERFCVALEHLFESHKSNYIEKYEDVKLIIE